jgi:hypothetical protein
MARYTNALPTIVQPWLDVFPIQTSWAVLQTQALYTRNTVTLMLFNDLLLFCKQKRSSTKLNPFLHAPLPNVLFQEVEAQSEASNDSPRDAKYALDVIVCSLTDSLTH